LIVVTSYLYRTHYIFDLARFEVKDTKSVKMLTKIVSTSPQMVQFTSGKTKMFVDCLSVAPLRVEG